jgi:hypothetical protein
LETAALDTRYHKDCWKTQCRPVWQEKAHQKANSSIQDRSLLISAIKDEAFALKRKDLTEALEEGLYAYTLRDILMAFEDIQ